MKKLTIFLPIAMLLMIFTIYSCTDEIDTVDQIDFNEKSFQMIASYDNVKIGLDDKNVYHYFINEKLQNKIYYKQDLSKSSGDDFKLNIIDDSTIRIENPSNTAEYYELRNINTVDDFKTFDIYTSDGQLLPNVQLNSSLLHAKCPWCWVVGGVVAVVEAVIEGTSDSDCQTAVKECRGAGGLPSTEIEEGFFGTSCKVTCTAK